MYRGTTPTITFKVNSDAIDLNTLKQVWVTISSPTNTITKNIDEIEIDPEEKKIKVDLSQEETLGFHHAKVVVQVRFLDEAGAAFASPVKEIPVERILKEGVIE